MNVGRGRHMTKLSTFCFHNAQATANAAIMRLCNRTTRTSWNIGKFRHVKMLHESGWFARVAGFVLRCMGCIELRDLCLVILSCGKHHICCGRHRQCLRRKNLVEQLITSKIINSTSVFISKRVLWYCFGILKGRRELWHLLGQRYLAAG